MFRASIFIDGKAWIGTPGCRENEQHMKAGWTRRIAIGTPLLAMLALCGCASITEQTHAYLGTPHLLPSDPAAVQILAAEPNLPKERLGELILSVEGNPPREQVEGRLKAAAARLGADGVFIVSDRTHIIPIEYWDWWGPAGFSEDWHRLVIGVAFKYKSNP